MNTLLRIEWLKIKNYTAFKVLLFFFGAGIVLSNFAVYQVINNNILNESKVGGLIRTFNPYSFQNTWQTTSYAAGFLLVLPAMIILMLVTNEYAFRTARQNIIDGMSREEFIGVKRVFAFLLAAAGTIIVFLTALTFGLFSGTDFSLNSISHVGYFFLKSLTYNMLAVLISVLVKKTGFAIGLFFIYMGAENILSQLLDGYSIYLKAKKATDLGSMGDYLPMNAADGLLSFPDNPLKSMVKNAMPTDYYWIVFPLAIFYLLFFIWWSRRKFIKADL